MRVVFTEQFFARLAEIESFVGAGDVEAAVRLSRKIVDRAESLKRFPMRGRKVPEVPSGDLRELIEGRYRIVYRVRRNAIEMLTVFEGHRAFPWEDATP